MSSNKKRYMHLFCAKSFETRTTCRAGLYCLWVFSAKIQYLHSSITAPLLYCNMCKEKHVGKNMFGSLCQIFTYELLTPVHTVDEIHLPWKVQLIRMQMGGGAGAQAGEQMSVARAARGEEGEREGEREGGCMQRGGQGRAPPALFTAQRAAALLREGTRKVSIHDGGWQMPEGGRRTQGWQLPLRHRWRGHSRMRKVFFFFCRWTDEEECGSPPLTPQPCSL